MKKSLMFAKAEFMIQNTVNIVKILLFKISLF